MAMGVGSRGVWALAISSALGLAVACGGDDDDHPPPKSSGGSSGKAGKGGSAGTSAAAGASGRGGSAGTGETAGKGGTAGVEETTGGTSGKGGSSGKAGKGGKGGTGGTGGTGGSVGGTGGGGEAGGGQGGGGEGGFGGVDATGGTSGRGGTSGTGNGTGGTSGSGTSGTGNGVGGTTNVGGEGGLGGEAGLGGAGGEAGAVNAPLNLFFSEYVENSGTNPRALEIVNKTGVAVDLSTCSIGIFNSAATNPSRTINLTGNVANNDVFVICSAAIGAVCDQTTGNLTFDGNDAISLRCGTTRLDIIGQNTGTSPGTQWGDTTTGTADQTLRRKCSVTTGDTSGSDAFVPSAQWMSLPVGTTSGLGSATCG